MSASVIVPETLLRSSPRTPPRMTTPLELEIGHASRVDRVARAGTRDVDVRDEIVAAERQRVARTRPCQRCRTVAGRVGLRMAALDVERR